MVASLRVVIANNYSHLPHFFFRKVRYGSVPLYKLLRVINVTGIGALFFN